MVRQELYVSQLSSLMYEQIGDDKALLDALYDAIEPYLTTNLSRGRMINEVWNTKDYRRAAVVKLAGTYELDSDGFMQFHVDEMELKQNVIDLFFEEVK